MSYRVKLAIYRGANHRPHRHTSYRVESDSPLSAMALAERNFNVLLPDDEYAAATEVHPLGNPRFAAGCTVALAEAA